VVSRISEPSTVLPSHQRIYNQASNDGPHEPTTISLSGFEIGDVESEDEAGPPHINDPLKNNSILQQMVFVS